MGPGRDGIKLATPGSEVSLTSVARHFIDCATWPGYQWFEENAVVIWILYYTVSHFSYAPLFQGPHFLTKMVESNILHDNLLIDILSV